MNVSSHYWSPFHAKDCVFSRNEQQKVYLYLFYIFFACHANPIYPEQQLIAFLNIRASMCKLFAATLFKFNDAFLPLVSD